MSVDYIHPVDLIRMLRQWADDVEDALDKRDDGEEWKSLCTQSAILVRKVYYDLIDKETLKWEEWQLEAEKWLRRAGKAGFEGIE
jgi:hypothetical protein